MRAIVGWTMVLAFAGFPSRAFAQEAAPRGTPLASLVADEQCAADAPPLAASLAPVSDAEHVARLGDRLAMGTGLVLGGAMLVGVATVPVIAGAAVVSAWQLGRAAWRLLRRHRLGQSLSLHDPEARAAWLSAFAGTATIGSAAVHLAALAVLATPATEIAFGLRATKNLDRARDFLHDHLHARSS